VKWDDLLGLLFLLVFLVLPALRGVLRREAAEEAELLFPPGLPPEEAGEEREKEAKRPVRPRPVATAPKPPPAPVPELERASGKPRLRIGFEERAILKGIVWHEILSEPRARRRWKPKRGSN